MRRVFALVFVIAGVAVAIAASMRPRRTEPVRAGPVDPLYASQIQTIFDRRCVVCHACLDSPCQLNLQSFEGVDRGGNKAQVYRPERLEPMAPTRMFIDAHSTDEWRRRFGFFPVVERTGAERPSDSLLYRLVEQRREKPLGGFFDVDAATACPQNLDELAKELAARPEVGMPFGFPPLSDDETHALADWMRRGSGGPPEPPVPPESERDAIAKWESFLNADDPKSRLVARYLFEHLFSGHLRFGSASDGWFRLVRSRTRAPEEIREIATARPYDDPGVARPYYRFRRVREAIVEKTHVPYSLDDEKFGRLRQLFFESDWGDASLRFPSYDPSVAANPFVAFQAIPARARYQFLLDDAYYFVKAFIHGPVCKGQVALNVIDEHFLIFFLSPAADVAVTDHAYLQSVAERLAVPAEGGDGVNAIYGRFKFDEITYLKAQAEKLEGAPGRALTDIWNGDGTNPDAVLTVYRHFDNAVVLKGAIGGVPKTAWVMDFPILERMYYDLVAGFDVFGNVIHQTSTRRYMNLLRIEGEDQFLRFLPTPARKSVRDSWYRGHGVSPLVDVLEPFYGGPEPQIRFSSPMDLKGQLVGRILGEALPPTVVGEREPVQWKDEPLEADTLRGRFEREARTVAATAAPFVRVFPDATLLRVRAEHGTSDEDLVYTVVRNRSHLNIDFMFLEQDYLVPEEDTLHVIRGIAVARPNLFLTVSADELDRFFDEWRGLVPDDGSFRRFVDHYGIRRNDPRFWTTADFFDADFARVDPSNAGILDLMRYGND